MKEKKYKYRIVHIKQDLQSNLENGYVDYCVGYYSNI